MDFDHMEADASPFSPDPTGGAPEESVGDIGAEILARLSSSPREDHQRLCAAAGAIAQSLRDQSLPPTPVAYFAAAAASLARVSRGPHPLDPATAPLLDFLSLVLPAVPPPVIRSRWAEVSETLARVLSSSSLPDAVVRAGLKCATHLVVVGDKGSWKSIESLFGLLLGFATDPRPKVRKQSHLCLYDVLQSIQNTTILALASKEIKNTLERFLLLAGGSKSSPSPEEEGPRGAIEVLYILNALRDCLPLMSREYKNIILKFCKPLLDMRQTIVTRSIMEIMQALCCSSTSEISPQDLLDLLCSVALSVDEKEKSADGMASIARLLHVGTKKVYHIDRQKCIVKLPMIFNALGDILATEHEEAIFAATEALKGLISSCIDENLINQGVEQIKLNPEGGMRRSGPTIIEKICATIEGFLGYRYSAVWDMSFQVLSAAFDTLGRSSSYLMAGTVKSLADMQSLSDDDLPCRKQLHECVGSAVGAMGPETFLTVLPLNLDAEDLSDANVWLLPVMKQHIIAARLSFFSHNILTMVGLVLQKSHKLEKEGRTFSARSAEGLVYSLWSLLPAFCNYPIDTSSTFKVLQKVLCNTLRQEPELRGIICSSLQILIRQNSIEGSGNSVVPDDEISNAEKKAKDRYTQQVKKENLEAIKSSASNFFEVLSDIYLTSSKDSGGCLQSTIHEFAAISEKKAIRKYFSVTMGKLLKVTEEIIKVKQPRSPTSMQVEGSSDEASLSRARALLLDLAVSFLPGLDMKEVEVLLIAIKPAFQDEEGLIQKKAYKILSTVLKERKGFLASKLDDLLELMITALPSCHFSAKRHRLDCLYLIIIYIFEVSSEQKKRDIISSFLTEIILALKESNKKTRNRAYELLVEIGHACGDEERGGKKENLQQFFNMVAGGLAGETPHMISAAVRGLARLAYEFSDLIGSAYSLLPSAFLLLQRKNREIVKANLGLLKVLVAKSKAEGLQIHLKGMVEGLLKWQDDTKNHFKAKVKLLLEMLVRKCGLDAVRAVMPEEHMKLLTNIRKIKEQKERKDKSEGDTESVHSKTSISRQSRWNHTRIFSDFGEGNEDGGSDAENNGAETVRRSKASYFPGSRASSLRLNRMRQSAKNLPEDLFNQSEDDHLEDDPLDLLDRQKTRSVLQSSARVKRKPEPYDEPELDSDGRLVVHEDNIRTKKEKILPSDNDLDTRSQASNHSLASSLARSQKKRRKTTESGWAYTGNDYTSKKAGGDLKKKDKLEPYAYWPLDRKLLNRRAEHKAVARKGMARVMKFTKKFEGKSASSALSAKGVKLKKKRKGSKKNR